MKGSKSACIGSSLLQPFKECDCDCGSRSQRTVPDKIHDKYPPLDSPLLDHNNRAPLFLLRNLNQIHRNLRGRDADTNTVDEATDNQHAYTVTARLDSGAQQPPKTGKGNSITAADAVGYRSGHDGANDRAAGKGGTDAALGGAGRVVEVVNVLLRSNDGGDGGNVETEARTVLASVGCHERSMSDLQHTANGGDGCQEVDIVLFWHMHPGGKERVYELLRRILRPVRG